MNYGETLVGHLGIARDGYIINVEPNKQIMKTFSTVIFINNLIIIYKL
jgi:hypothetical protein